MKKTKKQKAKQNSILSSAWQQEKRAKMKAAGKVEFRAWVYPECKEAMQQKADSLNKKRELKNG